MNEELTAPRALSGKVAFRQHVLPPIQAGKYTIQATQKIAYTDKSTVAMRPDTAAPLYSAARTLLVSGERLVLQEGTVKSVSPPRDSCGKFGRDLPHVVFAKRDLPWLWRLDDVNAGQDPQRKGAVAPWLALLVFTADDPPPDVRFGSLADLTTVPAGVVVYPKLRLAEHEPPDTPVQTIDIPVGLFNAVTPSMADLEYLAHTRIVQEEGRSRKSSDPENLQEEYSVVVANRLPSTEKTVIHLVCLAGMQDYLPGTGQRLPTGTRFVRLVSLDHWQFVTLEPSQDFQYLVANTLDINRGDPSSLRLPPRGLTNGDDAKVENALCMGYVALSHDTRLGDQTASWYHGPLTPYTPVAEDKLPVPNADALTRYDNKTGLFDVSYSAAWQLGRLLALTNKEYSVALHNWKSANQVQQIRGFEEQVMAGSLGPRTVRNLQAHRGRAGRSAAASAVADALLETLAESTAELTDETGIDGADLASRHNGHSGLPDIDPDELISSLLSMEPEARGVSAAAEVPAAVREWLGRLRLLKGVPYQYIVPDERMLPRESLRFVQVDRNWIDCLTDGALSIGRTYESSMAQDARYHERLEEEGWQEGARTRGRSLRIPAMRTLPQKGALSGFLINSIVVQDFPGMEVLGFATADGKQPLEIFHYERIAPNVLVCLFAGVVRQVRLMLPSEGLSFGLDLDNSGQFHKSPLRKLAEPYGPVTVRVDVPFRANAGGTQGVVDIQDLVSRFKTALMEGDGVFTSMEFALQMVDPGPAVIFKATAGQREGEQQWHQD